MPCGYTSLLSCALTSRLSYWSMSLCLILLPVNSLKHRPVTLDLNRRTTSCRTFLLSNSTTACPRCALENLCERELLGCESELLTDSIGDAISGCTDTYLALVTEKERQYVQFDDRHSSPLNDRGVRWWQLWNAIGGIRIKGGIDGSGAQREDAKINKETT